MSIHALLPIPPIHDLEALQGLGSDVRSLNSRKIIRKLNARIERLRYACVPRAPNSSLLFSAVLILRLRVQVPVLLVSAGMCKFASTVLLRARYCLPLSTYSALVTFREGTSGASFFSPSMAGLPICDALGVAWCSALLPFSRQVLTAGTSA